MNKNGSIIPHFWPIAWTAVGIYLLGFLLLYMDIFIWRTEYFLKWPYGAQEAVGWLYFPMFVLVGFFNAFP